VAYPRSADPDQHLCVTARDSPRLGSQQGLEPLLRSETNNSRSSFSRRFSVSIRSAPPRSASSDTPLASSPYLFPVIGLGLSPLPVRLFLCLCLFSQSLQYHQRLSLFPPPYSASPDRPLVSSNLRTAGALLRGGRRTFKGDCWPLVCAVLLRYFV
jgi:hypothetical protein